MALTIKCDALNVEFQDNYTSSSPNLVSGDEIKTMAAKIHRRFETMKDGAYHSVSDEYNPSGSDLVTENILSSVLNSYRTSQQQDAIDDQNEANILINKNALVEIIDSKTKNILPNSIMTGDTSSGITATLNADHTVTLSGTAGSTDAAFIITSNISIPAGTYVFSGCPSGGATAKYRIDVIVNESLIGRDTGNGLTFTVPSESLFRANIAVYRNTQAPEESFKPMLCTEADWNISKNYVPYVESRKTVIIEVGTGKTFVSLRKALEFATEHYSDNTTYEVRLFTTEYNVANDLTANELTTSSNYIGLTVTKNVRLVGVNGYQNCVIKLELDSSLAESVRKRLSTLNIYDNAELENITVTAKVCRYAVHDDFFSETDRKKSYS